MKPIMIRASAGTGKTYRLSLEFINLLLKYRINFDEILVITFTKKATAEIRERIFEQLAEIVQNTDEGRKIKRSFQEKINSKVQFNSKEIAFLRDVHQKMLSDKTSVHINTIDSFVNTIFSGIIAPYKNILDFKIDNNINSEILPEIYEHILQDKKLKIFADIFLQAKGRNLEQFEKFITDIIENRWLFEFINFSKMENLNIDSKKKIAFAKYKNSLQIFFEVLQTEMIKKNVSVSLLLQKDFKGILSSYLDFEKLEVRDISQTFLNIFTNSEFINKYFKRLLDDKNFWNGKRLTNKDLKELYAEVRNFLANFLYFNKALIEQFNIISMAGEILHIYDEIKFRDKIFTHSDISYYTFRFLYDPKLSIIDNDNVLNIFYEQLSYNTRFVLIDEFQDTSILQWKIFEPMLKEIISGFGQKNYGNIIVVGDEKQAIYGWRGGESRLLTKFDQIINSEIKSVPPLSTSYRSKPVMMNWLNKLFCSNYLKLIQNWQYDKINSNFSKGGFVQVNLQNNAQIDGVQDKKSNAQIYKEFVQNILQKQIIKNIISPANTAILMRKNKELKLMAKILDEQNIEYTLETSGSLFEYRAIKPIIFLLNFIVYEDVVELVKFLRSDLVLMHPDELDKILDNYNNSENIDDFLKNSKNDIFASILKIKKSENTLQNTLKMIIEEFGFTQIFPSEIELKNLLRFLEIATKFEHSNNEYTIDNSGFLKYCRAITKKDEYSEIGQTVNNSLKLLTIHKAKGLQFETVFTIFDVTGKQGGNQTGLKMYYDFADNFAQLKDYAFTFNYDKILKKSQKQLLIDSVIKRDQGDELNNLYVALTRAQNNLFIYLHYSKKGELKKLIEDINQQSSVMKNIAKIICHEFADDLQELSVVSHKLEYGKISKEKVKLGKKNKAKYSMNKAFKIFSKFDAKLVESPKIEQVKKEFLENQSILIGNIVHEYLSHIKYFQTKILDSAFEKTIAKYGGLMNIKKIRKIIFEVNHCIDNNSSYFDEKVWDRVFNEHSIFDEFGKEYRIDRLMIDTKNRKILILDYKTGSNYEQEQLDQYKTIIENLFVTIYDNYCVKTKFLEVKV